MQSRQRAFTLVELLVVISIIALLAGMALPAIGKALDTAKKAKVNAMISQLKVGITAFNTDYGTWPAADVATDEKLDNKLLYQILTGTEGGVGGTGNSTYNTRNIPYMEFSSKDLDSTTAPTMFVDPWYASMKQNPNQNYTVLVDDDYDNVIVNIPPGTGNAAGINAGVAIWDPGPPAGHVKGAPPGDSVNTDPTKYIRSW